jgi:kynureninase
LLNGTPSIPGLYSARSAYEIIKQIGVEAIRAKSLRQTQRLIELSDEAGLSVRSCRDPQTRGGVVVLDVPNGEEVTRELHATGSLGGTLAFASHLISTRQTTKLSWR